MKAGDPVTWWLLRDREHPCRYLVALGHQGDDEVEIVRWREAREAMDTEIFRQLTRLAFSHYCVEHGL